MEAADDHGQHRRPDDTVEVVRQVGALALDAFPGSLLPNVLVRELNQLLTTGGLHPELTEEIAADIFMGAFSDKFVRAARAAAQLLDGSLYARYHDLDRRQLDRLESDRRPWLWPRRRPLLNTFTALCARRAHSAGRSWSAANNGTILEQAQILTTHNLAALVLLGVQPGGPWPELAVAAYRRTEQLIVLSRQQRRPLPTIKDAAYAWRNSLFFLSLAGDDAVPEFLEQARATLAGSPAADTLRALLDGVEDIHRGDRFDVDGVSARGRRLLGWTTGPHWVSQSAAAPAAAQPDC